MPQSEALARLRGHLGKIDRQKFLGTQQKRTLAGDAGEFLTERLLDDVAIPWMRFDQQRKRYSRLVVGAAKRPDYLVKDGERTYLLDAKHNTLTDIGNGTFCGRLTNKEIAKLQNLRRLFGFDVVLLMWSRLDKKLAWTVFDLGEFKRENAKSHRAIAPLGTTVEW